jgi:putative nucleotidyltransferase with HDIG domain
LALLLGAWVVSQNRSVTARTTFELLLVLTAIAAELISVDLPGADGGMTFALPFAATLALVDSPAASLALLSVSSCVNFFALERGQSVRHLGRRLIFTLISTGVAVAAVSLFRAIASGEGATPAAAIPYVVGYCCAAFGTRWIYRRAAGNAKPNDLRLPLGALGPAGVALFGIVTLAVAFSLIDNLAWVVPLTLIPIWALCCGLRIQARMSESYYETVTALTMMLQRAHPYTHEHVDRVARTAEQVARQLGLPGDRARLVRAAAVLHDIGKIAVDEAILDKPEALSESERRHVENHPVWGAQILAPVRQFHDLLPWIRHHHERPDGTGYPDGLSDVEIPIESKIIAVVDAYDAMTDSGRRYRAPMSPSEAVAELRRCSGSQFDSAVVEVFGEMVTAGAG